MNKVTSGLLLIGTTLLAVGCQSASKPAADEPRKATDGFITLDVSTAPAPWEYLPYGNTMFGGTIQTTEGLSAERPCIVRVTDLVTEMTRDVIIGNDPALFPGTVIPMQGGTFTIDAMSDFRIGEGYKRIELIFEDAQGTTVLWGTEVVSGPTFLETPEAERHQIRRAYAVQFLPVFAEYRQMVAELMDGSAITADFGAQLEYDLAILKLIETSFAKAFIVHADVAQWDQIGENLADRTIALRAIGGQQSAAEYVYRDEVEYLMSIWKEELEFAYFDETEMQWYFGSTVPPPVDDFLYWRQTWRRHVYPEVVRTDAPFLKTYDLTVRVDTGLIKPSEFSTTPFSYPVEGSYLTNPPVFELHVAVVDTDQDGQFDTSTCTGMVEGQPLEQLVGENPLESHGHLITWLNYVQFSEYWQPTW